MFTRMRPLNKATEERARVPTGATIKECDEGARARVSFLWRARVPAAALLNKATKERARVHVIATIK